VFAAHHHTATDDDYHDDHDHNTASVQRPRRGLRR
jgi:hypothetical protein